MNTKQKPAPETFAEMERRVAEWVNAPGTAEKLAETAKKAREASAAVREALRPDPELMRQPMTI